MDLNVQNLKKRHPASTTQSAITSRKCPIPTAASSSRTVRRSKVTSPVNNEPHSEVISGFLKAVEHFKIRNFLLCHLDALLVVHQYTSLYGEGQHPTGEQIANLTGMAASDLEACLNDLVEKRYLHRLHPIYGDLIYTYKLGSVGGTLIKSMLPKNKKKKPSEGFPSLGF